MSSNLKIFTTLLLTLFFFPAISVSQNHDLERAVQNKARRVDGDFDYIALQHLAEILQAETYYSDKARKAILYLGEHKVTVTAFNPFVLIGKRIRQMPIDCLYDDGDILVPVKFFLPIVKDVLRNSVFTGSYTNGTDEIRYGVNLTGAVVEERANGTLIRVNTLEEFNPANISTRYTRKWLHLDILNGRVNPNTFLVQNDQKLVKKIVAEQVGQMAHIAFQMKRDMSGTKFNFSQSGNSIWISIPSGNKKDILASLKSEKEKWLIDKIVIDPGHGGRDPGTIGSRGTYEKDVVLAIAKKLRDLIRKNMKDVDVFMTRDDDTYISLKERTQFANKVEGKLFISIHANWNRNKRVSGASTYFLGLAKSEEALEISQRENAVIKYDQDSAHYSELTDEKIILATMAQNSYNKESQDFAAIIQENIEEETRIKNRGVKQAGFYVLVGASMPNVLVETAFMSNREEERQLTSSSFQQKIAEAIFESVEEFKKRYELTVR